MINNISIYKNKDISFILDDLVKQKIISQNGMKRILDKFHTYSLVSLKSDISKLSSKLIRQTRTEFLPPDVKIDDKLAEETFEYIMIDLVENRGFSWGCAGAIAGVALGITAAIVEAPVTLAAAAIWGVSHVVSVFSLTACAEKEVKELSEISTIEEDKFIEDFSEQFNSELTISQLN